MKSGNVSLRANQDGNENYNEAERISKSVKVDLLVSSITLNQNSATLAEGKSLQLTADIVPSNASNKTLIWESTNPEIATVDANGKVNALKQGSTIIVVKSTDGSNKSAQCELTVVKLVDGISINITTATLTEGQSLQLEATVTPDLANNKVLAWESNDTFVATVSQDGKVTAISKGTAIITVKSTDGSDISASCTVNVVKFVSGIVLSETELTLNEGQSATITATVTPDLANNKVLAWESSDTSVATVNQDGKVTAISKGSAIITAKSTDGSNISASCTVNVVKLVSSIFISDTKIAMEIGEQKTVTAYALPSDATNPNLRWYSENENVATVENGIITAIGTGTTYVYVESTDGTDIVEKCEVEVSDLSGVDSISSANIRVYVANGIINIANVPANQQVGIFLTNGTLVSSELSIGRLMTFQPSANGIYIVVVGTNSYKVIIR